MKLRNKKTGEIKEWDSIGFRKGRSNGWDDFTPNADSLAALNEVWEDYTTAEPLIKDEKIRKAVRAWAEAESEDCYYGEDATTLYNGSGDHIEFWSRPFTDLKQGEHYTIAELCGEEEE